jgi:hypothetical protein
MHLEGNGHKQDQCLPLKIYLSMHVEVAEEDLGFLFFGTVDCQVTANWN